MVSEQVTYIFQSPANPYLKISLENHLLLYTGQTPHLDKLELGHSFSRQRTHKQRKVIQTTFGFSTYPSLGPLGKTEDWFPPMNALT